MTDTQDVNEQAEVQDADATEQTEGNEQDSQPTGFDSLPAETQAEIRKLRRENASYRSKVKSFEDASKSEAEKREAAFQEAQERANKAEERARAALGKAAVLAAAPKANAVSARGVYASIKDALEFDDETGEPTNVSELIEQLKADDPDMFRAHSADGGKGRAVPTQDFNHMIRRDAGRK